MMMIGSTDILKRSGRSSGNFRLLASVGSLSTVFSLTNQPGGGSNDLALGKTATQSSTLPGYASASAVAASAVDGNPDGNFF
jgi:hypothetical protein